MVISMKNMNSTEKLYNEWLSLQPLKLELQHRMNQQFMFDFNYNSNHLEGNTLTYGQTKMLLLFGRTEGEALMRDYEEMKAHNVGLELMKKEALDKQRPLSESFIRELNSIILVGDFYKTSRDGDYRYKIHVGVYKTRPNSVITPTSELFNYASLEETPAMMSDLVKWYNDEERKGILSPVEFSVLFHYRYIRIHPFEDGNGRIARLLVNYILHRHGYPMIVIPTTDRNNYLDILNQCDNTTGTIPFDGANALKEQIKPFVDYIASFVEKKLSLVIPFAKGEIRSYTESDDLEKIIENQHRTKKSKQNDLEDDPENIAVKRQKVIVSFIRMNNKISMNEISNILKVSQATVKRDLQRLKSESIIKRIGGDRGGHWEIIKK